eukprot:TRINITY_DN597_c0_g2_i3.p1 TRINITY_DN597_c0_g2~~TRINITY_DN597_c0_g2_i3.p1  ORF type:complete len:115 (+),score=32.74 TRINITY_DN597_c0_g2_i3:150-494(+)
MEERVTIETFIKDVECNLRQLWNEYAEANARIETSMGSINANTSSLMTLFGEGIEQWVDEAICTMQQVTALMNQCEIVTKEFKQVEQVAKQTEYLKSMLSNMVTTLEANPKLLE